MGQQIRYLLQMTGLYLIFIFGRGHIPRARVQARWQREDHGKREENELG
jgi:hypothetical protein